MRFTQTRVAVDEKRVVLCRRALRNRKGSRMREFVARTDDKTLKCVVVIRRSARARRGVFAGYYNDEVIFTLNKDETQTKKTTVDGELTVGKTKFVPMPTASEGLNIVILD